MSQSAKDRNSQETIASARRRRVCAAGETALSQAAAAFARAGFSDATLVLRWREIVGPEVARFAEPVKLQAGPEGAVLTLKCETGAAIFLQHQTRTLVDRLNRYLGAGQIARVKLVTGSLSPAPEPPPHPDGTGIRKYGYSDEMGRKPGLQAALERLARRRSGKGP